jgi:hypothetical protein
MRLTAILLALTTAMAARQVQSIPQCVCPAITDTSNKIRADPIKPERFKCSYYHEYGPLVECTYNKVCPTLITVSEF